MKILTGALRGRVITFRPHPHLRPTADKVRKAIFDALQGQVEGRRVLDLFSGTGALGFEAFSNGAAHVTFVESDEGQAGRIARSAGELGLGGQCLLLEMDSLGAIKRLRGKGASFDLVFLDPPYAENLGQRAMEALAGSGILDARSLVVWECAKEEPPPKNFRTLKLVKFKVYGDTQVAVYQLA
jgi:16S rRNA (guanine(966)-N(2))-methyltransferase RsmD